MKKVEEEDIDQAIRLLEELKHNLKEIEKSDTYSLLKLQEIIKDRWGFPKYCLTARRNVRIYFLNKYADSVIRIVLGQNNGIPMKVIKEIMEKQQKAQEVT